MKVLSKILLILMVAMLCVTVAMPKVSAEPDVLGAINGLQTEDVNQDAKSGLQKVVGRLLGFLQIASALIAVVMIAVTGFRYITEAPEGKMEIRKTMVPIIVGILLVFFATSIAKFFIGLGA